MAKMIRYVHKVNSFICKYTCPSIVDVVILLMYVSTSDY